MTRPRILLLAAVMHDSDQFSVNLTHICGVNAVRLYELLIQALLMFSRKSAFSEAASVLAGFSSLDATTGTLP